jgi:dolichol-phosphate mannosyltransferase
MKVTRPKILIAIPAYNCSKQITRVLEEIDEELLSLVGEVAIIDNGSTDTTVSTSLSYIEKNKLGHKIKVYKNKSNYNLGGTHKVAFLKAEREGYTHVIILHGDNQAKSNEAKQLINFALTHPQYQTVLGSRFSKYSNLEGYDTKRIVGNKILNGLYSTLTFKHLEDLGSGLNLFALSDLDKKTYLQFADKLTFNYELILDLTKRKVNFAFYPITWREEDQVTNARNLNIFSTAIKNLLSWRVGKKYIQIKKPSDYKCIEVK